MPRRPDLFIIGAPKCGTTSLYAYLKGHPDVFMSPTKEPRYFSPDVQPGVLREGLRYGVDFERYLDLFAEARDEKRVGEATTRYLYSREAPRLIREFQNEPWIVAILRNPVDMMHSLHRHYLSEGAEDIESFEEALAAEDDRRQGRRVPRYSFGELLLYRDWARFGAQLTRWFDTFGPQRAHVMIFEDFVRQPLEELRRLLEFLEVDSEYRPSSFDAHNQANVPRSKALRSLLNDRVVRRTVRVLPASLRQHTTRRVGRLLRKLNRKPTRRDRLDPALVARLKEELASDVAVLGQLLGRDMNELWFGRKGSVSGGSDGALTDPNR